jgi:hypothetical protein
MLMKAVVLALVIMALFSLYARLAPSDPARWHVDPMTADDPGASGVRWVPPEAPTFKASAEEVFAAFETAVMEAPRVTELARDGTWATFIFRSQVFGFPDYLSVKATKDSFETTLSVTSRLRFGASDVGVNRKRLERLLARTEELLAEG